MSDNSNVYFILYAPGAKGKFVTEVCEMLTNTFDESIVNTTGNEFKGLPSWPIVFKEYLENNNLPIVHAHGWQPEVEQHKNYVDTILNFSKSYNKKLFVDCHYTNNGNSVEYMLEKGCKVIVIKNYIKDRYELLHNFFYKNIIVGYPNKFSHVFLKHCKDLIDNNAFGDIGKKMTEELKEMYLKIEPYAEIDFHLWPREIKDLLFKSICLINAGRVNYFNTHENCLKINYSDIGSEEILIQLSEFVDGNIDNKTLNMYNTYSMAQKSIPKYEDYIDTFYKNT